MSQKLFEANFITINTSAWDKPINASSAKPDVQPAEETTAVDTNQTNTGNPTEETGTTAEKINTNEYPPKATTSEEWTTWGKWLETRLEGNSQLDQEAKMNSIEITNEFFENFFVTNWGQDVGAKLNSFTDIKKYFIRNGKVYVAAFTPETSPILKYLTKDFVTGLISAGKFKSETFNAILIAYKERIVKANEFTKKVPKDGSEYNILYCLDLYEKSPSVILEYLEQQQSVLKDGVDIVKNKLTFLKTNTIVAFKPDERAKEINDKIKSGALPEDLKKNIKDCKLNDIALVKLIVGSKGTPTTSLNSTGQDTVITKLPKLADKFAAIFVLSLTTDSTKAKQAIKNDLFSSLSAESKFNAAMRLASSNILPKGQLNATDADALVDKIISSISKDTSK